MRNKDFARYTLTFKCACHTSDETVGSLGQVEKELAQVRNFVLVKSFSKKVFFFLNKIQVSKRVQYKSQDDGVCKTTAVSSSQWNYLFVKKSEEWDTSADQQGNKSPSQIFKSESRWFYFIRWLVVLLVSQTLAWNGSEPHVPILE